jgi:hypothetical protein
MKRDDAVTSKPEVQAPPMGVDTSRLPETSATLGLQAMPTGRASRGPGLPPRGERPYRTPSHVPVRIIGAGASHRPVTADPH